MRKHIMHTFKLGFVINPVAGLGGSVALKGSDGMTEQALALGAVPQSNKRASMALDVLTPYKEEVEVFTANGQMGEECAKALGFKVSCVYQSQSEQTQADDSKAAVKALIEYGVDVILFAGGDGTARDIANIVTSNEMSAQIPVLGIPAGCKIHSGVYAITPTAAGRVIEKMITKELVTLTTGDVMDIDENLFRQGVVKAKRYSEMSIPSELTYVQAVKSGGKESDELVLQDIAQSIIDQMHDEEGYQYVVGSGSTTAFLMAELGLENTLLGVDLVKGHDLIANDLTAGQLLTNITKHNGNTKLIITLIGGQGHIFGRGNQQLSPDVIKVILAQAGGKENIIIIATKAKLTALNNKPLICDTGDAKLNQQLAGFITVTTGYNDQVLYPVSSPA